MMEQATTTQLASLRKMELRFNQILHAIERPKLQAKASRLRSGFGWRYFDSILNPENAFADWSVDWEPHILIFKTQLD
jgi:hypothetical protein